MSQRMKSELTCDYKSNCESSHTCTNTLLTYLLTLEITDQ